MRYVRTTFYTKRSRHGNKTHANNNKVNVAQIFRDNDVLPPHKMRERHGMYIDKYTHEMIFG